MTLAFVSEQGESYFGTINHNVELSVGIGFAVDLRHKTLKYNDVKIKMNKICLNLTFVT
jgi:hypothetical protein